MFNAFDYHSPIRDFIQGADQPFTLGFSNPGFNGHLISKAGVSQLDEIAQAFVLEIAVVAVVQGYANLPGLLHQHDISLFQGLDDRMAVSPDQASCTQQSPPRNISPLRP